MMKVKKILLGTITLFFLFVFQGQAAADALNISNQVKDISSYIYFDENTKNFHLEEVAIHLFLPKEIDYVNQQIASTNATLNQMNKNGTTNVSVVDNQGREITVVRSKLRGNGGNSATFYWNFVRVRLSRNTIRGLGAGINIAGVWIPNPIVNKTCRSLGFAMTVVPHGVWFDYNYTYGMLCGNRGWQ